MCLRTQLVKMNALENPKMSENCVSRGLSVQKVQRTNFSPHLVTFDWEKVNMDMCTYYMHICAGICVHIWVFTWAAILCEQHSVLIWWRWRKSPIRAYLPMEVSTDCIAMLWYMGNRIFSFLELEIEIALMEVSTVHKQHIWGMIY